MAITAPLYNQEGKKSGEISLPDNLFGVRWNGTMVHEVVRLMQLSRRAGTAHTKGRGEVRGGGKKPWRQKGTGRARHGSTRSPLWVGGGTTFGPRTEKNYERKINKTVRRKALAAVLSRKLKDGEIIFVEDFSVANGKTKTAASAFDTMSGAIGMTFAKKGGRTLVLLPSSNKETIRAIRNLPYAEVEEARNTNVERILTPKYVVITKDAIAKISA